MLLPLYGLAKRHARSRPSSAAGSLPLFPPNKARRCQHPFQHQPVHVPPKHDRAFTLSYSRRPPQLPAAGGAH